MNFSPDSLPPFTSKPIKPPLPRVRYFSALSLAYPSMTEGYMTLSTESCSDKYFAIISALAECSLILKARVSKP